MIPTEKPYFISHENHATVKTIMKQAQISPVNILITGKHGLGKSFLAQQIAAYWKMDYVPVPICQLQEVGQLLGHTELRDGKTEFVPSEFVNAIQKEKTLVHLEELNRPESPKAVGELFPILDDTRAIWHENLGKVEVAPGVVFVGTLNEGFEYSGIDPLDEALRDRFYVMSLDYLPTQVEKTLIMIRTAMKGEVVEGILDLVNRLRFHATSPIHISTRRMIMMCGLIVEGLPLHVAFKSCIGNDLDKMESILIELDSMAKSLDPGAVSFSPTMDINTPIESGYGMLSGG